MNIITPAIAVAVVSLSIASSSIAEDKVPLPQPTQEVQIATTTVTIEVQKTLKDRLLESNLEERRSIVLERIKELTKGTSVDPIEVYSTVAKCENIALDTNLQSGHRYKFSDPRRGIIIGEQEKSFGLAMIHLPDHPTISHAQATDPEFALSWMVKEFEAGRQSQWTCWTTLFGVK